MISNAGTGALGAPAVQGPFTWVHNSVSGYYINSTTYYGNTYRSDQYSDPGVTHVLSTTTYSYQGTNNRTGTYVLPNNAAVSSRHLRRLGRHHGRPGQLKDHGRHLRHALGQFGLEHRGGKLRAAQQRRRLFGDQLWRQQRHHRAPAAAHIMDATYGTLATASVLTSAGGTYQAVAAADVRHGTSVGQTTGTAYIPSAADVRHGTSVDAGAGTCYVPSAADVRSGTNVDATAGTLAVPSPTKVLTGTATDDTTGSLTLPTASQALAGVSFGVAGNGTTGNVTLPPQGKVQSDTSYGAAGTQFTGTIDLTNCVPSNIKSTVIIAGVTGTLEPSATGMLTLYA